MVTKYGQLTLKSISRGGGGLENTRGIGQGNPKDYPRARLCNRVFTGTSSQREGGEKQARNSKH